MKKISILLCFLLLLVNVHTSVYAEEKSGENSGKFYACWISYLDIENNLKDLDEEAFRAKIGEMFDTLLKYGMNTAIVQVRPMGDAIYPSAHFHVSSYIDSDGILTYDPFQIIIEEGKKRNISIHAWINPYRLSRSEETTEYYLQTADYERYKSLIMEYTNPSGELCLSLDPSLKETNKLICDGISEILGKYDVDGIHFDDYFYVEGMGEDVDEATKKNYVNAMIKDVYNMVKAYGYDNVFGISPAGNLNYARNVGADIDTWLSNEGYIDYIIPQIYWSDKYVDDGQILRMFSVRCEAWQAINVLDKPMYVGLALYKVGEESDDLEWSERDDNMQYQYNTAMSYGYDGFALFRYDFLNTEASRIELDNLCEVTLPNNSMTATNMNNNTSDGSMYKLGEIILRKIPII